MQIETDYRAFVVWHFLNEKPLNPVSQIIIHHHFKSFFAGYHYFLQELIQSKGVTLQAYVVV
jgi:hypothetical protein